MTPHAAQLNRPIVSALTRKLDGARARAGRNSGASLFLDFARQQYYAQGLGDTFENIITYTRAGEGGRFNALGQYEMVPANTPRLTHDPVTLQPLGILIEEQRTNLLLNSVLAGAVVGVVGAGGALPTNWAIETAAGLTTEITATGVENGLAFIEVRLSGNQSGFYQIRNANVTITGTTGQSYAGAVNARLIAGSLPNGLRVNVVEATGAFAGTFTTAALTPAYQRIIAVRAVQLASAPMQMRLQHPAFTGAVDCTFRITAPQLESGASPSSYIPTGASQVTRAADVCSVNTLSPWYNAVEGTIVVEGVPSDGSGTARALVSIGTGAAAERIQIRHTAGTNRANALVVAGGVAFADLLSDPSAWPLGSRGKAALSYKTDNFAFSCNGQPPKTDASGAVPAASQMDIGRGLNSAVFNGTISRLTYYPRALSVAELQAITA
jgi:hypothetical protein